MNTSEALAHVHIAAMRRSVTQKWLETLYGPETIEAVQVDNALYPHLYRMRFCRSVVDAGRMHG